MTYLEFHLYFNLPLILLLAFLVRRRITGTHLKWIGLILLPVVGFTYPWDSNAVSRGIWGFGEGRVAAWIGVLPVEEILFFFFEAIAVALLTLIFLPDPSAHEEIPRSREEGEAG